MSTPVHVDEEREAALCAAIRAARLERMTQVELAERLGVKQTYVSRWELELAPGRGTVAKIEEALDLPAGTLMREAGYAEGVSTEDAIRSDLRLTPANQQLLLDALRVALRESSKSRKPTGVPRGPGGASASQAATSGSARSRTSSLAGSSKPSKRAPSPKRTTRTS